MKRIQPVFYFVFIFFISLFVAFSSSDILPIEYSTIFDEHQYIDIAGNFKDHIDQQDFKPYYNSRSLLPTLAYYILDFANLDHSSQNIRNVFLVFNFCSIILAIFIYFKISIVKKYSAGVTALGFCFLFVNFFILKFSTYYPVLMDVFGFTSGLLLYYFHLIKNKFLFYFTLMLSLFIFPTTVLFVFALIITSFFVFNKRGWKMEKNIKYYTLLIFVPVILVLMGFSAFLIFNDNLPNNATQSAPHLIPATLIVLLLFIYYCIRQLLPLFDGLNWNRKFYLQAALYIPIALYLVYFFLTKYMSLHFDGANTLSAQGFLYNLLSQFLSFPLKFLVSHFIYYGLIVCFIVYFRKKFFETARQTDLFVKLVVLFFVILSFGTETRQFLQLFPFIVFVLLDGLKKFEWNTKFLLIVFLFQLVWSRFWYSINVSNGFLSQDGDCFLRFPAQRYFQFQGPWMSTSNAIIYGVLLMFVYICVSLAIKKLKSENSVPSSEGKKRSN